MRDCLRVWNKKLQQKGIRVLPLNFKDDKALIYLYRPDRLKKDLEDKCALSLLRRFGYRVEDPELCVKELIWRMKQQEGFPHEIGLFIGYPPEDVSGFIDNKAKECKCVGCWKVYGDVEKAQKTFALYKKCTNVYSAQYAKGKSLEQLAVAI